MILAFQNGQKDPLAVLEVMGSDSKQIDMLITCKNIKEDPLGELMKHKESIPQDQLANLELAIKLKDNPFSAIEKLGLNPKQK